MNSILLTRGLTTELQDEVSNMTEQLEDGIQTLTTYIVYKPTLPLQIHHFWSCVMHWIIPFLFPNTVCINIIGAGISHLSVQYIKPDQIDARNGIPVSIVIQKQMMLHFNN